MSELENNVGEDRNDITSLMTSQTQATMTSQSSATDSKENFRKQLTKLSALPPLKNNPATRLPFKPVPIQLNNFTFAKSSRKQELFCKTNNKFLVNRGDDYFAPVLLAGAFKSWALCAWDSNANIFSTYCYIFA